LTAIITILIPVGRFFHTIVDVIIDTLGSMTYILVQH
jgi:hypothetical protein